MDKNEILQRNKNMLSKDEYIGHVMSGSGAVGLLLASIVFLMLVILNICFLRTSYDMLAVVLAFGTGIWIGMYRKTSNKLAFIPIGLAGAFTIVSISLHVLSLVKK